MIEGKNKDHCNTCPASIRGMCCWFSMDDGTDNFIIYPCEHLNKKTRRCKVYKKRSTVSHCLSMEKALIYGALPKECGFVKESDVIPIRPNKTYNKEKREMIIYELKKRRLSVSNSS